MYMNHVSLEKGRPRCFTELISHYTAHFSHWFMYIFSSSTSTQRETAISQATSNQMRKCQKKTVTGMLSSLEVFTSLLPPSLPPPSSSFLPPSVLGGKKRTRQVAGAKGAKMGPSQLPPLLAKVNDVIQVYPHRYIDTYTCMLHFWIEVEY